MKKSTKIIALTVLTLSFTSAVLAYGAHKAWKMSPERKAAHVTEMVTENLELNAIQQQNLHTLSGTILEMVQEFRAEHGQHAELLQQLLSDPTMDQARALQIVEQKTRMINDKAPTIIASIAVFLDSLDSEQKNELREYMGDRMDHHHDHD